jgi:opacity protein-like surface antigen
MRRARTTGVAAGVGLLIFVLGGGSASAEWFFDLYGGASIPTDPDVKVTRGGGTRETARGHSDTVWTAGGRGGYWFDGQGLRWLGVALDISYFEPEFTRQGGTGDFAKLKIETLPISPLAMFRLPLLESPEHPNGRLQPYVGIAPGVFHQKATVQFRSGAGDLSDEGFAVGVDLRAGVAYEFLPNWALFLEYRFTHVSDSFEGRSNGQQTTVDVDLNTNHVLFGLGYRFR